MDTAEQTIRDCIHLGFFEIERNRFPNRLRRLFSFRSPWSMIAAIAWRMATRAKWLMKHGVLIDATVIKTGEYLLTNTPFQESAHPHYIAFTYTVNGQTYQGRSPFIWSKPPHMTRVPVYIDPQHPNHHCLDLSTPLGSCSK